MGQRKQSRADGPNLDAYRQNAQHGQNRAGVDVESGVTFEEFESKVPIDPKAADDRIADEGPEIQARVHALGHDVSYNLDTNPDRIVSDSPDSGFAGGLGRI